MIKGLLCCFNGLQKKRKVQLIISLVLTLLLLIEIPVFAWFSSKKKMAVLGNVNAPYTLYLSSGNQEDLVYLDMSSIDVGTPGLREHGTHKDFVFSVQGSWDISQYYLQLAHTTNIPFEYTVYRVKDNGVDENDVADRDIYTAVGYDALSDTLKATSVSYTTHVDSGGIDKGTTIYYIYRPEVTYSATGSNQYGKVMDKSNYVNPQNGTLGTRSDSNTYYKQTYGTGITDKVQKNAVPLYMQSGTLAKNPGAENGKDFCDYYVLRVEWSSEAAAALKNDKETDMVYITVVSSSVVQSNNNS